MGFALIHLTECLIEESDGAHFASALKYSNAQTSRQQK